MLYRVVTLASLFAAANVAALPAVSPKAMNLNVDTTLPMNWGYAMDKCFDGCDMSKRPSCATAHEYIAGCGVGCDMEEKTGLIVAASDQPCAMPAAAPAPVPVTPAPVVPAVPAVKPGKCGTATCGPDGKLQCPACSSIRELIPGVEKLVDTTLPMNWGVAMDKCFDKCDMSKRPSCKVAHEYIAGCGVGCDMDQKTSLIVAASDQPCAMPAAGAPAAAAPADPAPAAPADPTPVVYEHLGACGTMTCGPTGTTACQPCQGMREYLPGAAGGHVAVRP